MKNTSMRKRYLINNLEHLDEEIRHIDISSELSALRSSRKTPLSFRLDSEETRLAAKFVRDMSFERKERERHRREEAWRREEALQRSIRQIELQDRARVDARRYQNREKAMSELDKIKARSVERTRNRELWRESSKGPKAFDLRAEAKEKEYREKYVLPKLMEEKSILTQRKERNRIKFQDLLHHEQQYMNEVTLRKLKQEVAPRHKASKSVDGSKWYQGKFHKMITDEEMKQKAEKDKKVHERKEQRLRVKVYEKFLKKELFPQVFPVSEEETPVQPPRRRLNLSYEVDYFGKLRKRKGEEYLEVSKGLASRSRSNSAQSKAASDGDLNLVRRREWIRKGNQYLVDTRNKHPRDYEILNWEVGIKSKPEFRAADKYKLLSAKLGRLDHAIRQKEEFDHARSEGSARSHRSGLRGDNQEPDLSEYYIASIRAKLSYLGGIQ